MKKQKHYKVMKMDRNSHSNYQKVINKLPSTNASYLHHY